MNVIDQRKAAGEVLVNTFNAARKSYYDFVHSVVDAAVKDWEKTGCLACNGSGQVLTWSTMDSAGFDEHGTCPQCHGNNTGLHPRTRGPFRSNYSHEIDYTEAFDRLASSSEMQIAHALYNIMQKAQDELKLSEVIERGDIVLVAKGRKLDPGTMGIVVSIKDGYYGRQVGMFVASGPVRWIAFDNVRKWLGEHTEEIKDLLVAKHNSENVYNNLKTQLTSGLPALTGSARQIAWAEKIRANALLKGKIDKINAMNITTAKEWIDNRFNYEGNKNN